MATEEAVTSPASPSAPVSTSHPIGFWFFFWGEFAERCSYYGMRAILALYMTEKLGVDKADAGTFMSLFIAACYAFPLVGGYLADNFFGKYWTIVGFSIPYVVAQFLVGTENKFVVFGALSLLAMGSGVIKPNISTLMGLTYDQQRPGQDQLRTSAFSWFYMSINIGAAISQFGMPILRTTYGYQTAFLFPAVLMALALAIFAMGKRFYATETIERKVLARDGQIPANTSTVTGIPVSYKAVTAEELLEDRKLKLQTLSRIGALFLTVMFFWAIFDQSASTWIFFADTYMNNVLFGVPTSADQIQAFNPVFIVLLVPVSVMIFKQLAAAGYKIKATQKMLLGFALTGLSMLIMSAAGYLAGHKHEVLKLTAPEGSLVLPAWQEGKIEEVKIGTDGGLIAVGSGVKVESKDFVYDAEKKKLTLVNGSVKLSNGNEFPIVNGHLSNVPETSVLAAGGVLESLLKTGKDLEAVPADASKVTIVLADWVKPEERVTVWWQVLAFLVITVAEILISITGLELAFVAAPPTMKSFVTACWLAVVFLANLLINAPITQLYPHMEPGVYFAMLAGAMVVVGVIFIPVASRFNAVMAEQEAKKAAEANTEVV